jgi:hypothetical protein
MRLGRPRWIGLVAGSALALGMATPARAGDITAFLSVATPRANWSRGYGAALSSTWFNAVTFEAEAARQPGAVTDAAITSFTASAFLSPSIGGLIPYGGLGFGVYRETRADQSKIDTMHALVFGLKLKIKGLVVLKGEYRRLSLSGVPLVLLDQRASIGAGLAF